MKKCFSRLACWLSNLFLKEEEQRPVVTPPASTSWPTTPLPPPEAPQSVTMQTMPLTPRRPQFVSIEYLAAQWETMEVEQPTGGKLS